VRELANVLERAVLLHEGAVIHGEDLGLRPAERPSGVEVAAGAVRVDFSRGGTSLGEVERTLIVEALRAAGGSRRRAAALLDITPETLRYRIEKYGLAAHTRSG
jgi:DNA-binding NtrC family response regulator